MNATVLKLVEQGYSITSKVVELINNDGRDFNYVRNFVVGDNFANYAVEIIDKLFNYKVNLINDKEGQNEIGESAEGIEFKLDNRHIETGNIGIEVAERVSVDKEFVDSGIMRQDNTKILAIGTEDAFFIVSKRRLIEEFKKNGVVYTPLKTLRCTYIPLSVMLKLCKYIIVKNIDAENKLLSNLFLETKYRKKNVSQYKLLTYNEYDELKDVYHSKKLYVEGVIN